MRQTTIVPLAGSLVVKVTVAARGPTADGSKVTVKLRLAPAATVVGAAGVTVKSAAFAPLTAIAVMLSVEPPEAGAWLAMVMVAVPVTAPAATTEPALAQVGGGGDVTTATGGTTQKFGPGGLMVTPLVSVAVQPVLAFVRGWWWG